MTIAPLLIPALLIGGALLGAALVVLLQRGRATHDASALATLRAEVAARESRLSEAERARRELQAELAEARGALSDHRAAAAAAQAALESERAGATEKLAVLQAARDDLANQFKALAAEILDEKSRKFVEVNQDTLTRLLDPLKTDLAGFRQRVDEVYVKEAEGRSALAEQVRMLSELNGTLREETTNLTKALKGDSKAQGDWGEHLLDRLLESAGLMEGTHYTRQAHLRDAEGTVFRPDVVLHLPQRRQMVLDSKVTLTAYSEYVAATDEVARELHLKAHLASVRTHIKGLGEKDYHALPGVESLDCVVMFLPLEGAFTAALARDPELFQFAWERKVLLVSPSTLLFVVRTVAHVWRQEDQSRNAQEIADRGGKLYDKFVAFVADLDKVGEALEKARGSYDEARRKLVDGSGNLVGQAEKLRKLGVKASKALPTALLGAANVDEEG